MVEFKELIIRQTLTLAAIVFAGFFLCGIPVLEMPIEYLLRRFVVAFDPSGVSFGLRIKLLALILLGVLVTLIG